MSSSTLSEGRKQFIVDGVTQDCRADGRRCIDFRRFQIETGIVSNTNGSARLRQYGTDVLVGIKAEIGQPKQERSNTGHLEFYVDCSSYNTTEIDGHIGDFTTQLTKSLERIYDSENVLDLKSLTIIAGEQVWVLYIDAVVLECCGNLLDCISIAVKAALYNTRIPGVSVNDEEGVLELEISDDPNDEKKLSIDKVPVIVSCNKIGHRYVVDATQEEECCSSGRLLIAVNDRNNICSLQKSGTGSLDPSTIFEMIETARQAAVPLNQELLQTLKREERSNNDKCGFFAN
ncbi:Exosome complex component RRP42 [Trichoplax sp. H2]|uniref:Ribosomal RNA-processing protein 42 n=1 Tax=Trichoplax adhaerens TaxID=10228 RepID=B3RVW2_TRIAD|nr:hypothetical protein TRIADDRAFT_55798 [Trichoplax adhaerens]EDV26067.1 hypothetical protein TRIADDRAFT_55798 [Trichoplax adhaerens]RDD43038.1 Exosome complex component RRP42 [Trichoplax sp. H2]|eukprot:XP_002112100.1 hypothetical protein TRIADDRAFT_55798 [Trichoplax adhaerens]